MMTLGDVVDAGHRGKQQRHQSLQMERQQRNASAYDAAGQRATKAMQEAEAQGLDRPLAMLKGAEQFGQALIEAGDMQGYLQHEAKIHPLRLRTRQEAMQRFQMDGDKARLIKSVYATIPNGEDVVGVEEVTGGPMPDRGTAPTAAPMAPKPQGLAAAVSQFDGEVLDPLSQAGNREVPVVQPGRPGDGRLGAPSGKGKLRVKVSTGDTRDVDFDQFMTGVQKLSQDPAVEIKLNMERELARIRSGAQIDVVNARGDQQRKTGEQMAGFKKTQAQIDAERKAALQTQRDGAAMERVKVQQAGANQRDATGPSGGGRGGGAARVARTVPDDNGWMIDYWTDGRKTKALIDGKPIRSHEWAKRVDKKAAEIGKSMQGSNMTPEQLQAKAIELVRGPEPTTAPPKGSRVQSTIDRLLGD